MAKHDDLPIYRVGTELLELGYLIQRDMLRGFKRSLGEKIVQSCTDMLEVMALANANRVERAANLQKLLALTRSTTVNLRVALNLKAVSPKLWSAATLLLQQIGAQAGGWLKSANRVPAA